ncbi:MAG: hypothetical protein QG602_1614, partial [Verrucomicrobiota bacterium]|nr:hypothetical protein [Verrucomicrobiota bacterium]
DSIPKALQPQITQMDTDTELPHIYSVTIRVHLWLNILIPPS